MRKHGRGGSQGKIKMLLEEKGFKVFFRKYSSTMRRGISNWIDTKVLGSESQFKIVAEKIKD